jgi:bifunctional enzyme CysN/CysC
VFKKICEDFTKIADKLEISDFTAIPVSALKGENVFSQSEKMKWYKGQHLMAHLETVPVLEIENETHFRMPVQLVQRPHSAYRGYAGTVYGASVSVGDSITIMPKNIQAKVSRLVTFDGDLNTAKPGDTVSLVLDDEYDASRGDVFVAGHLPHISDQFAAKLIWMTEKEMIPGRNYLLKCGTKTVNASITTIKATIDVDTLERSPAKTLQLNDIALCNIAISEKISIDSYSENKATGSFIIIDKDTGNTLGAGMIEHALRRSENIFWSTIDVDKNARATQKKQKPCVLWFTGLSGSGKSTIANLVDKKLFTLDAHSFILDGDNVRLGLCKDLGFNEVDRVENIRRVSQVARLMADAGLIVIVSFISPYKSDRDIARSMFDKDEFALRSTNQSRINLIAYA